MSKRDFVLARLAVVKATLTNLADDAHRTVDQFIDPEEDADGADRIETMQAMELGLHSTLLALQAAREATETMSKDELVEPEEEEEVETINEQPDDAAADDQTPDNVVKDAEFAAKGG